MDKEHLIRRDVPLEQGRELRFRFVVVFDVPINEDLTGDTTPMTLDDIERWLGGTGKYISTEQLFKALAGFDREVVEHTVELADIDSDALVEIAGEEEQIGLLDVRFELQWEKQSRERGESWSSRVWLDEVPPSAVTRS